MMIGDNDFQKPETSKERDADKMRDTQPGIASKSDPLLALVGSGRDLWANEHADEYVDRLREGWE